MNAPVALFNGCCYTITLFRSGKEVKEVFCDRYLTVCATPEASLTSWERSQIKGSASEDGNLYYLRALDNLYVTSFIWLNGKEEADLLRKAIHDAEDLEWKRQMEEEYKKPCSFCSQALYICGGDHGDEMRQIQREALERD
jgi:hypothetical protein